jgi:Domain of unknown function (DUF4394)
MRHRFIPAILALTFVGGLTATTAEASEPRSRPACEQQSSRDLTVVGLTSDQQIVCFREERPGSIRSWAPISGLAGDSRLVGIDYRPATSVLYGLGDAGGVYTVDPSTGQATKVAQMDVALSGGAFGVDFNPTVDRLRVVSDNGQNLRINVDTGMTIVDATLNTGPGTTVTGVTAVAYTNNDADPTTATTLFDIDTMADRVAIQAPPNNGTLNPTGNLGVDAAGDAGFDIYSSTTRDGATVNVRALASLNVGGASALYRVDLLTGRATGADWIAAPVVDLAFPL